MPEPAEEGEEAGGTLEFWSNFQTEAAAEAQSSGTQVWGPDSGQAPPFQSCW